MNRPYQTICEYCGKEITTFARKEYNLFLIFYILIIYYFYGFLYGSIIIGITFMLFQNITHICPNCYGEISYKSFYPISSKGIYITITYGKCIIVIKKIYIFILIGIILIIGIIINFNYYTNLISNNELSNKKIIDDNLNEKFIEKLYNKSDTILSWESLINDCGSKVMVENAAKGIEIFQRKYYKKKINWKGYFISAFIQRIAGFVDSEHLVNLNIRMIPSETIKEQDLILSLNRENYNKFLNELKLLKTGSPIQFEAIFEEIGDEWKPHHLHLVNIKLIDDFISNKEKVMLFKGINFNIEGHMKIQKEINDVIQDDNKTNINNNEKDLNFTLDEDDNLNEKDKNNSIEENNNNENKNENNTNTENNNDNNTIPNNNNEKTTIIILFKIIIMKIKMKIIQTLKTTMIIIIFKIIIMKITIKINKKE